MTGCCGMLWDFTGFCGILGPAEITELDGQVRYIQR